jgi:hypothetical protein
MTGAMGCYKFYNMKGIRWSIRNDNPMANTGSVCVSSIGAGRASPNDVARGIEERFRSRVHGAKTVLVSGVRSQKTGSASHEAPCTEPKPFWCPELERQKQALPVMEHLARNQSHFGVWSPSAKNWLCQSWSTWHGATPNVP